MANQQRPDKNSWFTNQKKHNQVAIMALTRHPLATFLTMLVISLSLTLPGLVLVMMDNLSAFSNSWQDSAKITLYLEDSTSTSQGNALALQLNKRNEIAQTTYVNKHDALAEFMQLTQLNLKLNNNPIPATIVLTPQTLSVTEIEIFYQDLLQLPEVNSGQLDLEWIQKLNQFVQFIQRLVWSLSILLAFAALLVMSNTIRMEVEARKDEILITRMVGATNAYIRRPFLLMASWYGLISGALAVCVISVVLSYVKAPLMKLLLQYHSDVAADGYQNIHSISGLGVSGAFMLLSGAVLICSIAVRFSVSKQLKAL